MRSDLIARSAFPEPPDARPCFLSSLVTHSACLSVCLSGRHGDRWWKPEAGIPAAIWFRRPQPLRVDSHLFGCGIGGWTGIADRQARRQECTDERVDAQNYKRTDGRVHELAGRERMSLGVLSSRQLCLSGYFLPIWDLRKRLVLLHTCSASVRLSVCQQVPNFAQLGWVSAIGAAMSIAYSMIAFTATVADGRSTKPLLIQILSPKPRNPIPGTPAWETNLESPPSCLTLISSNGLGSRNDSVQEPTRARLCWCFFDVFWCFSRARLCWFERCTLLGPALHSHFARIPM
jgi:hypothetical protein